MCGPTHRPGDAKRSRRRPRAPRRAGAGRRAGNLRTHDRRREFPPDIGSASYTHHLAVERAVTSRTEEWTILRPGTFANNLLSWAWTVKAGAPVRAPYINSAQAPIHEKDVADVAAAV